MHNEFTAREFRDALSSFATGVTIVTTSNDVGKPVGMTASSFNSVSMDPPLILWSVTKDALGADTFKNAPHFSVHVLGSEQADLSNQFAKTGTDKFAACDFTMDANGTPVLSACVSRFDCCSWACYEGGDHWIIVGQVEGLYRANLEPLIFSRGSYAVASSPPAAHEKIKDEGKSRVDSLLLYNLARAYRQMADQFHSAVQDGGLTVSEWRVLASLHGGAERSLPELAARTFVESHVLTDMIDQMTERGLCSASGSGDSIKVQGTVVGQERVEHLFKLSTEQERSAVGDGKTDDLKHLISLLQSVIDHTTINK